LFLAIQQLETLIADACLQPLGFLAELKLKLLGRTPLFGKFLLDGGQLLRAAIQLAKPPATLRLFLIQAGFPLLLSKAKLLPFVFQLATPQFDFAVEAQLGLCQLHMLPLEFLCLALQMSALGLQCLFAAL